MAQLEFLELDYNTVDRRGKHMNVQKNFHVYLDTFNFKAVQRAYTMHLDHTGYFNYNGKIPRSFEGIGEFSLFYPAEAKIRKVVLSHMNNVVYESMIFDHRQGGCCFFKVNKDPIDLRQLEYELFINVYFDKMNFVSEKIILCMEVFYYVKWKKAKPKT